MILQWRVKVGHLLPDSQTRTKRTGCLMIEAGGMRGSPIGLAGCGIWLFFAVIYGI